MSFNSIEFLIFLPIVVLAYYIIPGKLRYLWLLVSSYYFYMCWNPEYALLILTSTVITYGCSLAIEKAKHKRSILVAGILSNLIILFYFKYFGFAAELITDISQTFGVEVIIPEFDIILPVGISFYTFQALGYMIDVYREDVKAERNFFRYALFVSFFPQLVAGPIERSKNLLSQLRDEHRLGFFNLKDGIMLMLWGFFLKIVIADRAAIFVNVVYSSPETYSGALIAVATVLFAFQIYCDFYGYSIIAKGAARLLGIELIENFKAPYLSTSVAEFWRNWHISLTSWFKDYVYIPLGGSRRGGFRKQLNRMIVFLVSGLWHGADLAFVLWGALNGLYQVIGDILRPVRDRLVKLCRINRQNILWKILCIIITFAMVDMAWLFFRAGTLDHAAEVLYYMLSGFDASVLSDGTVFTLGLDIYNMYFLIGCIVLLTVADALKLKGITIRNYIYRQNFVIEAVLVSLFLIFILVFGLWGPGYNASSFIYFQF